MLFVVFVAEQLHGDAGEIGLLRGVQGIGAMAGGLALGLAKMTASGRLTAYAALGFGALSLAIWNAPGLTTAEPLFILLFIAAGAPGVGLMTGVLSTLQREAPEGQRGKVFATAGLAAGAGEAIGMLTAGVLGNTLGTVTVLNFQAALYLLAGLLAAARLTTPWASPGATLRAVPKQPEARSQWSGSAISSPSGGSWPGRVPPREATTTDYRRASAIRLHAT